jgi:hypothetical protein
MNMVNELKSAKFQNSSAAPKAHMNRLQLSKDAEHYMKRDTQTLRVVSGTAWITIFGDRNDHIITAGQEIVITRGKGKAIICAVGGPLSLEVR